VRADPIEDTDTSDIARPPRYQLEEGQVFSQSLLWGLQRRYYTEAGAAAWRDGDVPQYVTSNPVMANAYAEIVFAFWTDQRRKAAETVAEPLVLCELGAGSGRFAYHFLKRLERLCADRGVSPEATFRYVMTDFVQANLDAWREHPRFQPYFASGLLDMALFDVTQTDQLGLQVGGGSVAPGDLSGPVIVLANYLFDSIPQDLFYLDAGQCHPCHVSLSLDADPDTLGVNELVSRLDCRYSREAATDVPFPEPEFNRILNDYRRTLSDTYLLFPAVSLRCLDRLRSLSTQGLMLLSADKADFRLQDLQGRPAPELVRHGSFSFRANFYAFADWNSAGLTLLPEHPAGSVETVCFLAVDHADDCTATRSAYRRFVHEFSPDDYFTLSRHFRPHASELSGLEILAFLRLSRDDSHQFARYLPRLTELAPDMYPVERTAVTDAADRAWDIYFPLGGDDDLAYGIGTLLYAMDDYPHALTYFERSVELNGPHTGALFNMAVCHNLLGRPEAAAALLRRILDADPENVSTLALLAEIDGRIGRIPP
jgi:tetratricopeptide (TPR) repeat protein